MRLWCHSLLVSFLSPATGARVNPSRSIFRRRSHWFLSASGGSSAAGGGGEPRDRRAVYISFAYRLGVGRLETFLPLAMVVPGTIYLILISGVGVGCFVELGDFVEVTFCFFIGCSSAIALRSLWCSLLIARMKSWCRRGTEIFHAGILSLLATAEVLSLVGSSSSCK
jgi:hypothetical protein